jgi:hypothetical protein
MRFATMRGTKSREGRGWPAYIFGGRLRTSTAALLIAFFGIWWLYGTYTPAPAPPAQVPASNVVPPGFIPDPAYTWAPRTDVLPRTTTTTTTTTPTTTTSGETTTPTTSGETSSPSGTPDTSPTSPGASTTGATPTPTETSSPAASTATPAPTQATGSPAAAAPSATPAR